MAKIVLGIGTSHGPLLSTPPDMWNLRAKWDRSQLHPYQGRAYTYEELRTARRMALANSTSALSPMAFPCISLMFFSPLMSIIKTAKG